MNYRTRITSDPGIMLGKPIIKGTRITIELILRKLSEQNSIQKILDSYPHLEAADIYAALSYAADMLSKEELIAS
jgi:uncharacterized protein (DUF433 family)